MIPAREELPEDAGDWSSIEVTLPHLPNDSPSSCPCSLEEIVDYIRKESADLDEADESRLSFLRTAEINEKKFWLWKYTESDGEVCYVTFSEREDGSTILGLSESNGLSPEQYILADYYDEVYW